MSNNSTREACPTRTNSDRVALNCASAVRQPNPSPCARVGTTHVAKCALRGASEVAGGIGASSSTDSGSEHISQSRVTKCDFRQVTKNKQPNAQNLKEKPLEEEEEEEEAEIEEELLQSSNDKDGNLDGFLDDFARELDDSEEEEEEEDEDDDDEGGKMGGEETGQGGKRMQDGDEQVACALQEEEWRRNPPLSSRVPCSRPFPRGRCGDRYLSDIVCTGSGSGSIFDITPTSAGRPDCITASRVGGSSGGSNTSSSGSVSTSSAARGETSSPGWRADDAGPDGCAEDCPDCPDDVCAHRMSPVKTTKRGRETNCSSSGSGSTTSGELGWRKSKVTATGEELRGRLKGPAETGRPAAWPPGGLSEGEGLRINDLPDEIVDKIACFASLPRCVSKRIERYRVKVFRERVIAALESSAKLPAPKAKEVEDAIFGLCGCSVTKAYKAKAREMSFNLRVGKNDPLRERLLSGSLLPSELVRMTSNELAPLSVRRERERLARKRIQEVTSSRDSPFHTVTDRFSCLECGFEKTQYRTWRRKAVVDRVRVIVQCLQCRHSWEL